MKFEPKTEEEVVKDQLCPEGLQPFTILEAEVVLSKSEKNKGKEQLKIKLNVHADDGYDYHVYDYVAPWFMAHKFRHLFFAVGCGADYEAGTVNTENLIGREGYADIFIGKAKGEFPPRESVRDYNVTKTKPEQSKQNAVPAPKQPAPGSALEDQDIPF